MFLIRLGAFLLLSTPQNSGIGGAGVDFFQKYVDPYENSDSIYSKPGMDKEALVRLWKVYKKQEATLGKEHEDTVETLIHLGKGYVLNDKYKKAEQVFKRAYTLTKSRLGQNHKKTIDILYNLASVYWDIQFKAFKETREIQDPEQFDLALRYFRKVYDVRSKDPEMGEEHTATLEALEKVGAALALKDKIEESAATLQKVLDIRTKTLGEEDPLTLKTKAILFLFLSMAGKTGQAKKFLEEKNQEKDEEKLWMLVMAKVEVLEAEKKYEKAVELLTTFYEREILKSLLSPCILDVLDKLVLFSQIQGHDEQTLKWASKILDLTKNQGQTERINITSQKDEETMIISQLNAIEAAIGVFSKKNLEAESVIDDYFKMVTEVTKGQKVKESPSLAVLQKCFNIEYRVAEFKEKIGNVDQAAPLFLNVAQKIHDEFKFVAAISSLVKIARNKDDYKMMTNVALKFFQHNPNTNNKECWTRRNLRKFSLWENPSPSTFSKRQKSIWNKKILNPHFLFIKQWK